jgi:small subunit ribosomal protein S6
MRINEDVIRYLTLRVDQHEEGPSVIMQSRGSRDERRRDRDRAGEGRDGGDRDRAGEAREGGVERPAVADRADQPAGAERADQPVPEPVEA